MLLNAFVAFAFQASSAYSTTNEYKRELFESTAEETGLLSLNRSDHHLLRSTLLQLETTVEEAIRWTDLKLIKAPQDLKGSSGTKEWKISQEDGGKWDVAHVSGGFADDVIGRCDIEMADNDRLWYFLPESPPFLLVRITLINPTTLEDFSLPPVVLSMWMTGSRTVDHVTTYRQAARLKVRLTALPFTTSDQVVDFLRYVTGTEDSKLIRGVEERAYSRASFNPKPKETFAEQLKKILLYLSPTVKSTIAIGCFLVFAFLFVNGVVTTD